MSKFRNIYSTDQRGRDVDSFADDFKRIFLEFGHTVNFAYIDYAWDNGLSLEQAAWDAISADREMEFYICDDYTLQLIERLRNAAADDIPTIIEDHEARLAAGKAQRLVGDIPERVLKTRGWAPQAPPKRGFYCSRDGRWYLLVNRSAQGNVLLLLSVAIDSCDAGKAPSEGVASAAQKRSKRRLSLPPMADTAQHWQARIASEELVYKGDFWGFRDDLIGHPWFGEYGIRPEDDNRGNHEPVEWLL